MLSHSCKTKQCRDLLPSSNLVKTKSTEVLSSVSVVHWEEFFFLCLIDASSILWEAKGDVFLNDHVNKGCRKDGPQPAENHGNVLKTEPTQDVDHTIRRVNIDIMLCVSLPSDTFITSALHNGCLENFY